MQNMKLIIKHATNYVYRGWTTNYPLNLKVNFKLFSSHIHSCPTITSIPSHCSIFLNFCPTISSRKMDGKDVLNLTF